MNEYFSGGPRGGEFDAMYYWNQFHPILSAIAILLIGWIVALILAAAVKKVLQKLGTNQKLSSTTGHRSNVESILSRVIFWLVMIVAVVGALNVLNLTTDFLAPVFIGINTWCIWRCHIHHHHNTQVIVQTNT